MWNRQSKNTNIYHVLIILSHFSPRLSKHPLTSTNKSLPVVVLLTECIAASSSIIANIYVVPVAVLDITALVLSPGGKSSDWSSRFPTTSSIHVVYLNTVESTKVFMNSPSENDLVGGQSWSWLVHPWIKDSDVCSRSSSVTFLFSFVMKFKMQSLTL